MAQKSGVNSRYFHGLTLAMGTVHSHVTFWKQILGLRTSSYPTSLSDIDKSSRLANMICAHLIAYEMHGLRMNFTLSLWAGLGMLLSGYCQAGDFLSGGYPASRYETLWMKSPFSVATSDTASQSPDFLLVGLANLDGVDYASLVNKKTNERYLLASGKPQNGLTLVSVTQGQDRDKTFAVVQNNGETLTLKLSAAPPALPVAGGNMVANGAMSGQPRGTPQSPSPAIPAPAASPVNGASMNQVANGEVSGGSAAPPQSSGPAIPAPAASPVNGASMNQVANGEVSGGSAAPPQSVDPPTNSQPEDSYPSTALVVGPSLERPPIFRPATIKPVSAGP